MDPGHIIGKINVRTHQAAVDVYYDTQQYSILYRNSTNLDYANGMILKNYLNRDIQTELSF